MKDIIEIGGLLYFDKSKFKRHVDKRINEGNIEDEKDLKKLKICLMNF